MRLAEFADLLLEFVKIERSDVDLSVPGHPERYGVGRCRQSAGEIQFRWRKVQPLLRLPLNEIFLDIGVAGVVVLAFAGCAATTESFSTGASTEGSAR